MPTTVLITLKGKDGPPSLEEVAAHLGLSREQLTAEFKVTLIDPKNQIYSVEIDGGQLPANTRHEKTFSNPEISTFGRAKISAADNKPVQKKDQTC